MRRALVSLAGLLVVAAVAAGVVAWLRSRPLNTPANVQHAYLADWQAQHWQAMRSLVAGPPADFVTLHTQMLSGLNASGITLLPGRLTTAGGSSSGPFSASVSIRGVGTWTYQGRLALVEVNRHWKVAWAPGTLEPQLRPGQTFGVDMTWPQRAPILGLDGSVLQGTMAVETAGVEPANITNLAAVTAAFQQLLNISPSTVTAAIHAPGVKPTYFVPLAPLRPAQFAAVGVTLSAVPGILFEQNTARVPISPGFATPVLGTTGPITAELLAKLGAPYTASDTVGLSGLEQVYERQLAGSPAVKVELLTPAATTTASAALAPVVVHSFPGTAPQPVQTTIDPAVQMAGDAAMAGATQTTGAALVAVDAATGEIRAIVNEPGSGFDRALDGIYPPGSTFKIVTTEGLLANGDTLSTPVTCPTSTVVDGETFKNIEGEATGNINLSTAFTESCNTAYVQMASALSGAQLVNAADAFGFNAPEGLPLVTSLSSVPHPKDLADQAGAAIGQSEDLASPLHMAEVAAAVASGTYHAPQLVVPVSGAGVSSTATPTSTALDPTIAANLRTLMGLVVTQGTGTAANLPGTPVYGKTGTAEFGTANPPQTDAWFVGFRGNIAFAVIVEAGGVGGKVAAPLAANFLTALPTS